MLIACDFTMSIWSRGCLLTYLCTVLTCCCLIGTNCYDGKVHHLRKRSLDNTLSCRCESQSVDLMCTDEPTDCNSDETRHENSCYRFFQNDPMSRYDARVHCMQRHSHLVYIGSVEEQLFIQSFATHLRNGSHSPKDNYWIGLTSTLRLTWQDGSPFQKVPDLKVPDGHGCFYISGKKLDLKVGNCEMTSHYVCEIPSVPPEGCKGSTKATSCYVFSGESSVRLSQGDAQVVCSLVHGGHLVTIDSTEELTFIRGHYVGSTNENTTYWIGLKSDYIWLDGTRASYQAFNRVVGSHRQGDLCFRLVPWNNFLWNDHRCSVSFSYICERELPAREKLYTTDDVCLPHLANLNRLVSDGPVCVRNSSDVFGIPILSKCGTEDCVEGCSCVAMSGSHNFTCTCGYCSFSIDTLAPVPDRLSFDEWQVTTPPLSCTCTNTSGDGRNQTMYQFQDGAFGGLNNLSCWTIAANSLSSSLNPAIIVGVIIAVLVIVVIVSSIVLCRCKRSSKSSLSDLALTVNPQPNTEFHHDYKANTHDNATSTAVAQGIDDGEYADPGYEEPPAALRQKPQNIQQIAAGQPRNPSGSGLPTPPKVKPYKLKKNDSSCDDMDNGSLSMKNSDNGKGIFHEYAGRGVNASVEVSPVHSAPNLLPDCRTSDTTQDDVCIEAGYQTLIHPYGRKRSKDDIPSVASTYATHDPNGCE